MVDQYQVERVQTGVRMEKRILKVLKGLAEYHDISLGDLLEGIVLHVFEGKQPFGDQSLAKIGELKKVYHLDLTAKASHRLVERKPRSSRVSDARRAASRPRATAAIQPARLRSRSS